MLSATEALARLQEGNRRFVAGEWRMTSQTGQARRDEILGGQEPFAVVLGCSDSRVPVEIIFDQGLGDLFVIRVAGNIAAPSQIGSVEFAVERFGVRLVVVLGHSNCGAVQATLETIDRPGDVSPALHAIVDRIMPSLTDTPMLAKGDCPERTQYAVRANVRHTMQRLTQDSEFIHRMQQEKGLLIVGADYSLDTGKVDFFEIASTQ